ncbi:unnamed protein product [Closterium sp. NIES-65]|nr:unnamed protein product [Closterium sp. NIES-65]
MIRTVAQDTGKRDVGREMREASQIPTYLPLCPSSSLLISPLSPRLPAFSSSLPLPLPLPRSPFISPALPSSPPKSSPLPLFLPPPPPSPCTPRRALAPPILQPPLNPLHLPSATLFPGLSHPLPPTLHLPPPSPLPSSPPPPLISFTHLPLTSSLPPLIPPRPPFLFPHSTLPTRPISIPFHPCSLSSLFEAPQNFPPHSTIICPHPSTPRLHPPSISAPPSCSPLCITGSSLKLFPTSLHALTTTPPTPLFPQPLIFPLSPFPTLLLLAFPPSL